MCDGDKADVSLYVYWLCGVVWFVRMTVFFIAVCMCICMESEWR